METLHATSLWTPEGWRSDVGLRIGDDGRLAALDPGTASGTRRVVPGIANLHSHAFQRAMAGMAERQTDPSDSFWTWRETMYRFAARFSPQSLYDVAAQLYVEMLEAGYTTVCEFHYLHHAPDGRAYDDPAAMSRALIAAARDTGIRLTLLPVLYMTGGFDGRPLGERQRRFGHDVDAYLRLLQILRADAGDGVAVGCALHSLRAVPEQAMAQTLAALPSDARVHIHIAEQIGEVQDCLAIRNARPVEWLLDHAPVDARWTLVHATHLTSEETQAVARSGATVAICTTTEANLGDGLFPVREYFDAGGRWGVGSDSHISVCPVEELRWLEYGQRLITRHRNIAVSVETPSVGETLMRGVAASAGDSSGHAIGTLRVGEYVDAVVLDEAAPVFAGARDEDALDRWLFAGNRRAVRETWVGGRRVVAQGRHRDRDAVAARYADTLRGLLAAD
ncbi:formimidoylglutamate deiminase [Lysobacter silvisoli]|uniref:Formimidoylglutamate deiminase n=1 Tax=Lysobacter silvisoli TaxID=2293254 RepID=A0A371K1K8_9GAMM|nr:formimidoylglutamate deiminase [Lysobacter silvisoli]RDZ27732.1 formimidoylglutamate deiminase [Lysobacter silvisoli]